MQFYPILLGCVRKSIRRDTHGRLLFCVCRVYHGPTVEAKAYFEKLHYELPPGESIADWLIDISSGRLGPSQRPRDGAKEGDKDSERYRPSQDAVVEESEVDDSTTTVNEIDVDDFNSNGDFLLPGEGPASPLKEPTLEFKRSGLSVMPSHEGSEMISTSINMTGSVDLDRSKTLNNTENIFEDPAAQAKARREVLYGKWRSHFSHLSDEELERYEAPEPYDLPESSEKASFWIQLGFQLRRLLIVAGRNWVSKFIDSAIIIGAAVLVSVLDGTEQVTIFQGVS